MSMNTQQAVLEYQIAAQLGEGPFWNHQTRELYWVDIEGKLLHIYDPVIRTDRTFPMPSRIGTVVPAGAEEALVALKDGIYKINTRTAMISLFCSLEADLPDNRFNDGKCDPAGRLWVGSMDLGTTRPTGALYRIDPDGKATKMLDSITISNGIAWTSDQKTMYYIDTPTRQIRAYDYDHASGDISNERVAVEVPRALGHPDGMAIDEEDKLWVGIWGGHCVARFDPRTGQLLSRIEVPALNVTSCAFGGANLDTLYITTASTDMTEEEQLAYPIAGALFKAVPGVRGVKSAFFGGPGDGQGR
ncbi:MAG: SMP-30/gluconolactonase/LRE family protein [Saprospirales bacterium]|nr:SMP-30/gluconolactonase/LRE family protein [Saprospirales bacterium]